MKILIIAEGFFPGEKYGGPPVSVDNFCTLMTQTGNSDEYKCYIITRNHDLGDSRKYEFISEGWNNRGNCKVLYLSDKEFCYRRFMQVAEEIDPDILYLQSLFSKSTLPALFLAKKINIKTLLAPRGELCSGAFKKKYKKIPYIIAIRFLGLIKKVMCQSTSKEESIMIHKLLGISKERIVEINNIPSIPKYFSVAPTKEEGSLNLIFVSRIVEKKNLRYAIELLKHVKGNVCYDIYGPIEDKKYWEDCKRMISELPSNVKVRYRGLISHDDIHKIFSMYHGFLFPTFSENYGQVIAESLFAGCPVIISDQTPWYDVTDDNAGWAIALNNREYYVKALQELVEMNQESFNIMHENAKQYVSKKNNFDKIRQKYIQCFKNE